jgi:DDE superfamily endonuclease
VIIRVCENDEDHSNGRWGLSVSGVSLSGEQVLACRRRLDAFRWEFYWSLTRWSDALFELADAVLCVPGPVTSLPELSLAGVHRRGHGSTYAALADGRVDVGRLRWVLAGLDLPRGRDGQIRLAVDVTPWPRPDAECSPQRAHAHRPCRCDGVRQTIPGWPYSIVAALESGRSSWTAPLDAVRLVPGQDATEITAGQIRDVFVRLRAAGQWTPGDPPVVVVLDAGYDVIRLAFLLADLPIRLLGRIRADRVFHAPAQPYAGTGRPSRHGPAMKLDDPATWPTPAQRATGVHERYGTVVVTAWGHHHPQLQRRAGWAAHPGPLPIVAGALVLVRVDRLPGDRAPKPVWLWHSHPDTADLDLLRLFHAFLRRFDLEHTFRFLKQTLGWTRPRLRHPDQADRWTWLILAAYTQLRLARHLTDDLRRPWEKPVEPGRLTPGRVRRGFIRIHRITARPASAPKPSRPGPGRPKGIANSSPAPRYPVGRRSTVDTPKPKKRTKSR